MNPDNCCATAVQTLFPASSSTRLFKTRFPEASSEGNISMFHNCQC